MIRTIIYGANGHMGRIVCALVEADERFEIAARVDALGGEGCLTDLNDFNGETDCIIDFSHHSLTDKVTAYAAARHIPLVLATTGQTEAEKALIEAAGENAPIFFSANMSPAIAMLCRMAAGAAKMFPDADIEIIEKHHNRKVDVPSGTALMLANAVKGAVEGSTIKVGRNENGKRAPKEITVHSLRIGNEVGTHEIIISTGTQTITLKHEAHDRALFAQGALMAAGFLIGKPHAVYNMQALLQEEE